MKVAWQMLSAALPLLAVLVFFILPMYLLPWFKKFRTRKRRSPLTEKLLRGPGETLRRELDERQGEKLSERLMKQIEHRLEERCRDVEPSQYGKQERFGRPVRSNGG